MTGDTADLGPTCPSCGHAVRPDDNFCEACRAELAPASSSAAPPAAPGACPDCPDAAVTPEGYCESCGRRVPGGRDHIELDLGLLAGISDRGLRHHQNEDAMALAIARDDDGPVAVAVVCDGVSGSTRPEAASLLAAETAMGVLLTAVRTGEDHGAASGRAVAQAQAAVAGLTGPPGGAPSATFVSAVLTSQAATVCWLGDSRAYWLDAAAEEPDRGPRALTTDDSLAQEMVAAGLLAAEDALESPQAHVVTRWIGGDADDTTPHITRFEPPGPGVLLLCSDGLWNYQPDAAGLAGLALPAALTEPLTAAAGLVRFALDAGGQDNITVVLAPFPPIRKGPTPT
jgi:serine/threonine protein phosphatase PrpC